MHVPRPRAALAAACLAATVLAGCGGAEPERATAPPPVTTGTGTRTGEPSRPAASAARTAAAFRRLERRYDAQVGLYALDTGTGRTVARRAASRFAFCSTGKALAAAAVLGLRSDAQLGRVVDYGPEDARANSPITDRNAGSGMTLRALASAALRYSDNTAANLVIEDLGGPRALQRFLQRHGDDVTRMDRYEPELSTAVPGDLRDTTTPRQLAEDLRQLALGDVLRPERRATFIRWLRENTTGVGLIRAGVPSDWVVGDKTGSGGYGARNDIAVLWPPGRPPIVLAILTTRGEADAEHDDALIAAATRVAVGALAAD